MADHARQHPITVLRRVLEVVRSGEYAWKRAQSSARTQRASVLRDQIPVVFPASRQTSGRPRVHAALRTDGV
ncbi:MAG: IS3 family transposase, partial [Chloroflexaceae bacterium]|nr:IS3 family transposase [Chloroflexaceae bacterium]